MMYLSTLLSLQFDNSGEATIITTHDRLAHYLGMLTHQVPIESQFKAMMIDNLNAEIVLGTVTNVREAAQWLSYSYLHTRMNKNPLAYGLSWEEVYSDPELIGAKRNIIVDAARQLKNAQVTQSAHAHDSFTADCCARVCWLVKRLEFQA